MCTCGFCRKLTGYWALRASDTKRSSKNYADRVLRKFWRPAPCIRRSATTSGTKFTACAKAAQWLKVLQDCVGLKQDMLCVEYAHCGSLGGGTGHRVSSPAVHRRRYCRRLQDGPGSGIAELGKRAAIRRHQCGRTCVRSLRSSRKFIYSRKVLSHISPTDRAEFFALLCSLVNRDTIVVVDSITPDATVERNKGTWSHAIADVKRDLLRASAWRRRPARQAARRHGYYLLARFKLRLYVDPAFQLLDRVSNIRRRGRDRADHRIQQYRRRNSR